MRCGKPTKEGISAAFYHSSKTPPPPGQILVVGEISETSIDSTPHLLTPNGDKNAIMSHISAAFLFTFTFVLVSVKRKWMF
jgi:hypothetical protein